MFWSLLHRTILWELVKVFSLALVGITGILLLAGIIAEMTQQGLSPSMVLTVIPLLVPSTLPYTIPATTLFAVCIVYGRLAHDNEVLAVRAAGISLARLVWPGVVLGLVMGGITMALYYRVIPYTHRLLRTIAMSDAEEVLYGMLKRDRQIHHPRLAYAMWVRKVQGRTLVDALFKRRDARGNFDLIAWAPEAEMQVDMAKRQVLVHMRGGWVYSPGGSTGYFQERLWEVPLPPSFGADKGPPKPRDQTWQEILRSRTDLENRLELVRTQIAMGVAMHSMQAPPAQWHQQLKVLQDVEHYTKVEIRALEVELQMRPALCVGCLCFVLVGCPIGIWLSRSDYLSAFITCFLPIVFCYYPLMLCGTNLAKNLRYEPAALVWTADAAVGLVGVLLVRRLLRQ